MRHQPLLDPAPSHLPPCHCQTGTAEPFSPWPHTHPQPPHPRTCMHIVNMTKQVPIHIHTNLALGCLCWGGRGRLANTLQYSYPNMRAHCDHKPYFQLHAVSGYKQSTSTSKCCNLFTSSNGGSTCHLTHGLVYTMRINQKCQVGRTLFSTSMALVAPRGLTAPGLFQPACIKHY